MILQLNGRNQFPTWNAKLFNSALHVELTPSEYVMFVSLIKLVSNLIIKVVCMVNLKLAFTEWFFYNLVILMKLCKIWYLNLDKALLFLRNQVICQKKWKLWQAPTTTKFNIFCWNFVCVSYLTMSAKGCMGFF